MQQMGRSASDLETIDNNHPAWVQLVDLCVSDIEFKLAENDYLVYHLANFYSIANSYIADRYTMPFYTITEAYRTSLGYFCPKPIEVKKSLNAENLSEWANERGVGGLIGLHRTGNSVKIYLTHAVAIVLLRLEFN